MRECRLCFSRQRGRLIFVEVLFIGGREELLLWVEGGFMCCVLYVVVLSKNGRLWNGIDGMEWRAGSN